MSISSIYSVSSAGYGYSLERRSNTFAENATSNKNTGPDTTSFSQEALKRSQGQRAGSTEPESDNLSSKDTVQSQENVEENQPTENLSGLVKKSMFSILLESLFFAELTESAAGSSEPGGNELANEDGVIRQQSSTSTVGSPLKDSEKLAQIKDVLIDFAKGKGDLSDVLKAVTGGGSGGSAGEVKSGARKTQGGASVSSDNKGKDTTIHSY